MSGLTLNISASDLKQLCLEQLENITDDEFIVHHRPHHERPKPIFGNGFQLKNRFKDHLQFGHLACLW